MKLTKNVNSITSGLRIKAHVKFFFHSNPCLVLPVEERFQAVSGDGARWQNEKCLHILCMLHEMHYDYKIFTVWPLVTQTTIDLNQTQQVSSTQWTEAPDRQEWELLKLSWDIMLQDFTIWPLVTFTKHCKVLELNVEHPHAKYKVPQVILL